MAGIAPINKGNGHWLLRKSAGYENGHKRMLSKTVTFDPNMPAEQQRLAAIRARDEWYADMAAAETSGPTLDEYAEEWLNTYCARRNLERSTIGQYHTLIDCRIRPQMGMMRLRDITPRDINQFLTGLHADGLTNTYALKYYTLLRKILACAVRDQIISANPADAVDAPRIDSPEKTVYNSQQLCALIDALEDAPAKWRAYGLLAIGTSMRREECVALDWSDVDFDRRQIHVRRACAYVPGSGQYMKSPKTRSGQRVIDAPAAVLDALAAWKREQNVQRLQHGQTWTDAIFTQDDGQRMNVQTPTKWFPRFCARHDLPPLNLHGLRHTGASLLIAAGADIVSVSRRLGHSRPSTTSDIYAHAYRERDALLSDTIGRIMDSGPKMAQNHA